MFGNFFFRVQDVLEAIRWVYVGRQSFSYGSEVLAALTEADKSLNDLNLLKLSSETIQQGKFDRKSGWLEEPWELQKKSH